MDIAFVHDFMHLRAAGDGHLPRQVLAEAFGTPKPGSSDRDIIIGAICDIFWDERASYVEQLREAYPNGGVLDIDHSTRAYICTREVRVSGVLKEVSDYCRELSQRMKSDDDTDYTVIILTDGWNAEAFDEYRNEFIAYAFGYDIWLHLLLATDFGLAELPFLPRDPSCRRDFELEESEEGQEQP